jgi:excisionase family DNA binding protein
MHGELFTMSVQKELPVLLTVKEVSEILRIHRPKVYILIRSGGIKGFKVGSDWRIRRDSVEDLVGPIPASFFLDGLGGDALDDDEAMVDSEVLVERLLVETLRSSP